MDKIGPYQILETVQPGKQPLFRARAKDGRVVAIKAIAAAGLDAESRERFTREGETCRTLDHPNIVKVFDVGEADGYLYQVMEMLEGADLGKVMADSRHFTWEARLSIMEQVAGGLEYAHARKLVHRDIKPANLFLQNSGVVKVLDFGMVRVAESELTKIGSSLGTLNYMAPEQIRGERCTAAADVFSAGIVFYQLASGRHPFSSRERGIAQVVTAIVFEAPPKLNQVCPDAPEGLEFILNRALEKDPQRRIRDAGELKQALGLCRMTLGMAIPPSAPQPVADPGRTRLMQSPAPAPGAVDPEKTRLMPRQNPASLQPAEADHEKTRLLPRQGAPPTAPPAPMMPPPQAPPAPRPPAAPRPAVVSGANLQYCPACTTPNPAGQEFCSRCGSPLRGARPTNPAAVPQRPWALYVAIAVAVLLAIALIAVLSKNSRL